MVVLMSKPNTRATHRTRWWPFVKRFRVNVMPVAKYNMVSSSGATSLISGFIKIAPFCLALSRSPLILTHLFSHTLFLSKLEKKTAQFAINAFFVPITPSISVPKPSSLLMPAVEWRKFNPKQKQD